MPAVAIFWVDAEDHDWEEVRSCTVLDAEFQPRTVTLPDVEGAGELPIAALTLDARVEQSLQELADALPQTEFTATSSMTLRAAWRPGVGMARAFATWIEGLLGRHGLVVFESNDPAAKPLVADVFARELASPGRTSALAADAGERFAAIGHAPQVVPQPDSVSLFRLDGGRRAIRRQGDQYVVDDRAYPIDRLSARRRRDASRLQPECAAQAARPGHALPHHLLRRGSERARVSRPAPRRLRGVRRADAVDFSARDRHAARLGRRPLSREILGADRGSAAARMNPR